MTTASTLLACFGFAVFLGAWARARIGLMPSAVAVPTARRGTGLQG